MNSDDIFYELKEKNKKKRNTFATQIFIISIYAFLLACVMFNWPWWKNNNVIAIITSVIYFLIVMAYVYYENNVFEELDVYFNCKKNYIESNSLIIGDKYVPINNGDFVRLSNNEYFEVCKEYNFAGKDIDFNSLYSIRIELKDLYHGEVKYSTRYENYDSSHNMKELVSLLQKDGLEITEVYSKYGDVRWWQNEQYKESSNFIKSLYKIEELAIRVLYFVIVVAPALFVLFNR